VADSTDDANATEHAVDRILADGVAMVQLLGPQDRLLRVVEREHPDVQVHVRGNEITLTGAAASVARARALVDELIAMARAGRASSPPTCRPRTVSSAPTPANARPKCSARRS
jgi:phosphate starvation-inducible PhoH-like protein